MTRSVADTAKTPSISTDSLLALLMDESATYLQKTEAILDALLKAIFTPPQAVAVAQEVGIAFYDLYYLLNLTRQPEAYEGDHILIAGLLMQLQNDLQNGDATYLQRTAAIADAVANGLLSPEEAEELGTIVGLDIQDLYGLYFARYEELPQSEDPKPTPVEGASKSIEAFFDGIYADRFGAVT